MITPSGMTVQMSCLHARGISDLPMGNVPGLQHMEPFFLLVLGAGGPGNLMVTLSVCLNLGLNSIPYGTSK